MSWLYWVLVNLCVYGEMWLIFLPVAYCAGRWGNRWHMLRALELNALIVIGVDVMWIHRHGLEPQQSILGIDIAACVHVALIDAVAVLAVLAGRIRRAGIARRLCY
jgi:hypothetical protein